MSARVFCSPANHWGFVSWGNCLRVLNVFSHLTRHSNIYTFNPLIPFPTSIDKPSSRVTIGAHSLLRCQVWNNHIVFSGVIVFDLSFKVSEWKVEWANSSPFLIVLTFQQRSQRQATIQADMSGYPETKVCIFSTWAVWELEIVTAAFLFERWLCSSSSDLRWVHLGEQNGRTRERKKCSHGGSR